MALPFVTLRMVIMAQDRVFVVIVLSAVPWHVCKMYAVLVLCKPALLEAKEESTSHILRIIIIPNSPQFSQKGFNFADVLTEVE